MGSMGESLRDQLVKTGLVTREQVKYADAKARKAAEAQKRAKQTAKRKGKPGQGQGKTTAVDRTAQAHAQKVERDRALNRQREAARARKALESQIAELVQQHKQNDSKGEIPHYFTRGKKIKAVYVNEEQHRQLVLGRLATVVFHGRYYVVAREVADKIRARAPDAEIHLSEPEEKVNADDPYAGYQVPDDLTW
jgi:uncharacterized protein YaiL (DUF2058 family)